MDVGQLDRRVALSTPTSSRGAYGEDLGGFSALATVWGRVVPASGAEVARLGGTVASMAYKVTIRYRADVDVKTRVVVEGKTLNIRAMAEVGRRQWLDLFCDTATP